MLPPVKRCSQAQRFVGSPLARGGHRRPSAESRERNVRATSGMRCRAMLKMSHCRATDSVAVSVLPNVAIILPDPKPVLAIRQVLKLESAKACEIKACDQDLSQSKT